MSIPNAKFSEKLFMEILFTLRIFAKNLLRGRRRRNTFCILFRCLAWASNPGFTSNKPTHYPLGYGDFRMINFDNVSSKRDAIVIWTNGLLYKSYFSNDWKQFNSILIKKIFPYACRIEINH